MVRLKASISDKTVCGFGFQFHNGSIKSYSYRGDNHEFNKFQFHNGSIKSPEYTVYQSPDNVFQFHNGSIKSARLEIVDGWQFSFNSTMVRLKGSIHHEVATVTSVFQFHNGSIKRPRVPVRCRE